jgi:serine/threonine protein phosphatase PrpC
MPQKTEPFSGITHPGKVRDNNEDAFLVERIIRDQYILACVIDGVGGYEGGEVAAHIARECILNHLKKPSEDLFLSIREAVVLANDRIYAEKVASDKNQRMACVLTLAVVDLTYNQFYYAHVGDTRLYLLRDHTLIKVTRDDSFVGFLEDSKRLSEEEAMNHPKRNEINKALGFDPNMGSISDYIETGISPFLPGDTLLLCSDGLTDMIDSKTITSILTSKQKIGEKARTLINSANEAGGKDNVTVVLVQNNNQPVVQKATKPPAVKKNESQKEPDEGEAIIIPGSGSKKRNYGAIVLILSLLCLGLLGTLLWQLSKDNKDQKLQPPIFSRQRNAGEQKLQDSIDSSSELILYDSIYGKSIGLTDTIFIGKDSMYINGNGMVLTSDSLYNGAGILVSADCKFILLENLVFENFEKAIVADNNIVQLKNVRFTNCVVSLHQQYRFPENRYITGTFSDTILYKIDSLPQ